MRGVTRAESTAHAASATVGVAVHVESATGTSTAGGIGVLPSRAAEHRHPEHGACGFDFSSRSRQRAQHGAFAALAGGAQQQRPVHIPGQLPQIAGRRARKKNRARSARDI